MDEKREESYVWFYVIFSPVFSFLLSYCLFGFSKVKFSRNISWNYRLLPLPLPPTFKDFKICKTFIKSAVNRENFSLFPFIAVYREEQWERYFIRAQIVHNIVSTSTLWIKEFFSLTIHRFKQVWFTLIKYDNIYWFSVEHPICYRNK